MATKSQIAAKIASAIRAQLEESLPRLSAAMHAGQASSSISFTAQVLRSKKNRLLLKLSPRERIPFEPIEYDVHIDDDGQLALGLDPNEAPEPPPKGNGKDGASASPPS